MEIGGVADHIHMLAFLSATLPVADVIRDIKANSSRWMNEQLSNRLLFEWQKGYGAFTVSYSQIERVRCYIQQQEAHHRNRSFEQEYMEILTRHGIAYRREYLFEDEHHA